MSMMNNRSRPNIMRHIGMSSGEAQDMRVETRIIEPRTFTQSSSKGVKCRLTYQKRGYWTKMYF